ncbi:hypothetical protein PMI38_00662 [Pseudomonas sp. GM84]|uniref:hypothetical protein n=1 Tax=Pseudomonas sp. GM84 TaxID=1144340 RepID=UPI00026FA4B6|nr:hypothetical protein [Pseudomonas sp. GM84]EJN39815.1 hypothetical protein PMI38_00662 [Pseudomonas sp. GM84]
MDTPEKNIPDFLYKRFISTLTKIIAETLDKQPYWWVQVNGAKEKSMIFDSHTRLLWDTCADMGKTFEVDEGAKAAAASRDGKLSNWRLPTKLELTAFAKTTANPLRKGIKNRLKDKYDWLSADGNVDLDTLGLVNYRPGALMPCNEALVAKSNVEIVAEALRRGWQLRDCTAQERPLDLNMLQDEPDLMAAYLDVDYISARLPKLDTLQFTDPNKGLWEFWGMDEALLARQGVRARNPALDVRDSNVAIDFGTNSTVVAYDDNDQHKLLRVGLSDYWQQERAEHYENPTLLEFIHFPDLLEAWHKDTFRPGVSWDQVRYSHAAQQSLRDNNSDPRVVASILAKIKQWALRESTSPRVRLSDRQEPQGMEHELAALTLRNPVRGQAMQVSPQDPFDPIELYAWFLGLHINWRGRGLFLRYYMTFPVAYPREVKDKILASFRRGLMRSLPATLVGERAFAQFAVEERASEPAAYAAGVMPCLGIKPDIEGFAYAVFDFGGGTTDFDFGYYRLPTPEEEDEGKEEVFEHFGAAGDKFLGGENLLENLAYRVFRHNLDVCRDKKIAFTRPLDAEEFAGSEMFLQQTQAASTNTAMLMSRLRPLWEKGALENTSGIETLDLLDRSGQKVSCQLAILPDALNAYLEQRVEQGVCNFLAALEKAFAKHKPDQVQVLLAGNASRSQRVLDLFRALETQRHTEPPSSESQVRVYRYANQLFSEQSLSLVIHEPLTASEQDPFTPTAKTGVALGLLRLCPGSPVKVINRTQDQSGNEAPFAHYVGRVRQGTFLPIVAQGSDYEQWHELGAPSEGVFNLYHSQSPQAHTGMLKQGEPGLFKKRLDLFGHFHGQRVFARIVGPSTIEICTAASHQALEQDELENNRVLDLDD